TIIGFMVVIVTFSVLVARVVHQLGCSFIKQKTPYEIGLGIPAEPLFRSTIRTFPDRFGLNELNRGQSDLETYGLFSNLTHDFLQIGERRVGKEIRLRWAHIIS